MTTRVIESPSAVDALLAVPALAEAVGAAAAEAASGAAEIVPHHTGHAAESYQSTPAELTETGLVATAYTDDFAGAIIEFGSINNPPYRPLTRAVERLSLRHKLYGKGEG